MRTKTKTLKRVNYVHTVPLLIGNLHVVKYDLIMLVFESFESGHSSVYAVLLFLKSGARPCSKQRHRQSSTDRTKSEHCGLASYNAA